MLTVNAAMSEHSAAYLIGIILSDLTVPFTDRFIGYHNATGEHHLLGIAILSDRRS
jgi:hypothetical protein